MTICWAALFMVFASRMIMTVLHLSVCCMCYGDIASDGKYLCLTRSHWLCVFILMAFACDIGLFFNWQNGIEKLISGVIMYIFSIINKHPNSHVLFLKKLCVPSCRWTVWNPKKIVRTWIGLSIAVRPGRRCSVTCLHFQGVRALLLSIKHDFGEDFAALQIDLEELLALVARRVDNVVVHLRDGNESQSLGQWNI